MAFSLPENLSEEIAPLMIIAGLFALLLNGHNGNITGLLGAVVMYYFARKAAKEEKAAKEDS